VSVVDVPGPGGPGRGVWALASDSDVVRAALAGAAHVRRLEVVGEVPSTQDVARTLAGDGTPTGTLVISERQTAGRGRRGRRWVDDGRPGASLAATLVLEAPDDAHLVPHAIGLAVLDTVAPWLAGRAALKWPNDVVVRTGGAPLKVAGLLVEREDGLGAAGRTVLLAGIGLNVDRRHLPRADDRAGLADLAGADVAPPTLLSGLLRGLDGALALLAREPLALIERYRGASDTRGREVDVITPDGAGVRGRADIDDAGRLVVTSVLGRHTVVAGTVRDAAS
jgi:BirA family biotin operon repressor/biotin-[acetyl-CoA-carboxylase] ligase